MLSPSGSSLRCYGEPSVVDVIPHTPCARESHDATFAFAVVSDPLMLAWVLTAVAAPAAEPCQRWCVRRSCAPIDAYMQRLDAGHAKYPLPQLYREVLRPHYPRADLDACASRSPITSRPDNATTDCDVIYFNSESYVAALRDGAAALETTLAPARADASRAVRGGWPRGYAQRWWDELEAALRRAARGSTGADHRPDREAARKSSTSRVHGAMPLERDADAKAGGRARGPAPLLHRAGRIARRAGARSPP
jgi:hypothetical protein